MFNPQLKEIQQLLTSSKHAERRISKLKTCLLTAAMLFVLTSVSAQQSARTNLAPDEAVNFLLAPGEAKAFVLRLRKDAVAEISWTTDQDWYLSFALLDPAGKDLIKDGPGVTDSYPFVAPLDGEYVLTITMKVPDDSSKPGTKKISLVYRNRLNLPTGGTKDSRKINGYEVKILKSEGENAKSFLLIERNGSLKKVYKGEGEIAGGFSFADDLTNADSAEAKVSANLVRTTLDKTGDGNPDVEVSYYSGGAHCCFTTLFYELGESVQSRPPVETNNAELVAVAKSPRGGLRFKTFDDTFSYWNTSFAESPMPELLLEFSKGNLRPNWALMRKPAPSMLKLRNTARAVRTKMSLEPYAGATGAHFEPVFWGVMLDLMYTGHEDLAWQYLDMVWPARKAGKEIFIRDFRSQLSESPFWQTRSQQ